MEPAPTPDELQTLLANLLAGVADGSEATWRRKIGKVTMLPLYSNVRSNWSIDPSGTAEDLDVIAKAVRIVREAHPYVAG